MDLLFVRYASPFLFTDETIRNCRFDEFVNAFVESENEKNLWDVWLHKIFDKTFDEFRESVIGKRPVAAAESEIKETISESKSMMENFVPEG